MMEKLNSRMYCLRKLKKFGVSADLLLMFYNAVLSLLGQPVGVGIFQNIIII